MSNRYAVYISHEDKTEGRTLHDTPEEANKMIANLKETLPVSTKIGKGIVENETDLLAKSPEVQWL